MPNDEIIPATPDEKARYTGEHAAIPAHMSYACIDGVHGSCKGYFPSAVADVLGYFPCRCPCHNTQAKG